MSNTLLQIIGGVIGIIFGAAIVLIGYKIAEYIENKYGYNILTAFIIIVLFITILLGIITALVINIRL